MPTLAIAAVLHGLAFLLDAIHENDSGADKGERLCTIKPSLLVRLGSNRSEASS